MNFAGLSILVALFFLLSNTQNSTCDYSVIGISMTMDTFTNKAYKTPTLDLFYQRLNSLRASILSTYLICFNKSIIDPDALYPQDISQCLMGLHNTSLLYAQYTGQYPKIKGDIGKIAKVVFSTQNDCRPVMNYQGWTNISNDCKNGAQDLADILVKYENDIILGKNGTNYIPDMLLSVEKLRKLCGFDILTKPKRRNGDSCQQANINWLYPVADQFETIIHNQNYLNYTAYFYLFYQSVYRAYGLCNSNDQAFQYFQRIQSQEARWQLGSSWTRQAAQENQKSNQGNANQILIKKQGQNSKLRHIHHAQSGIPAINNE